MANTAFIEPDIGFINELKQNGGGDLSKCYQCATCTVACNLTPLDRPFPRREMILAQWGSADKLIYNSDIWLCHNCGDCSDKCPRGANPAETLTAIRNLSFLRLTKIPFLGKMHSSAKYIIAMYAVPVVLFLVDLIVNGRLGIPEGEIVYSKLFSLGMIDVIFLPAVAIFVPVVSALQIVSFWKGMRKHDPIQGNVSFGAIIAGLIGALIDVMTHARFAKCGVNKPRMGSHGLMFYGFIALFITTNLVMLYSYGIVLEQRSTPLPLDNPVKLLGNFGAAFAFVGTSLLVLRRFTAKKATGDLTFYDSTFLFNFYLVILTGIGAELLRLADIAILAYPVYFIHLVTIFYLLAYLPFTKFAHLLYRTTAMVYARVAGRK